MKYLVSIVLLASCLFAKSQQPFLRFGHIRVEDGLSHEDVNVIIQDKSGFMWFGTADGLNRYDGYQIKTYKHSDSDLHSISSNWIWALHVDIEGKLWVGTRQGLNLYNEETDGFERITFNSSYTSRAALNINSITSTDTNQLWIGTWGDGLIGYNHKTRESVQYRHDSTNSNSPSSDKIGSVITDKDNNLWMGTWNGINRMKDDFSFERYYQKDGIAGNKIIVLHADPGGGIWAGTSMNGLTYINPARNTIVNYNHTPGDLESLSGNVVTALTTDPRGELWVGTYVNGLNHFNHSKQTFESYKNDPIDQYSLPTNYVRSLFIDKSGEIWMGTQGVSVLNQFNNRFKHLRSKSNGKGLINNSVWAIEEDNESRIWIGTEKGLTRYNPVNGETKSWKSKLFNIIYSIEFNGTNKLWLGTEKPVLAYFDLNTETFHHVIPKTKNNSLHLSDDINTITKIDNYLFIGSYQKGAFRYNISTNKLESLSQLYGINALNFSTFILDKEKNIWLGTIGSGLLKLNPYSFEKNHFKHIANDSNSLSDNVIHSLFMDEDQNLWIGTSKGLNKIPKGYHTVIKYNSPKGLSNEAVCGVVMDLNHNIWLSTYYGISRFDTKNDGLRKYDHKHGLQGNNFNENSQLVDSKGNIYFGGKNGLTVFHPDEINERAFKSELVFTSLDINNEKKDSLLREEKIVLSSNQNFIRIGFSSLDFAIPEKNRYFYMMDGIDDEWKESSRPFVNYTDLPHGRYIFMVKGTNSGGDLLSDTEFLNIRILPPWYLSWLAICIYAGTAILMFYYYRRKIYQKAAFLNEIQLKEFESSKIKEIDTIKSSFFNSIYNELRTPLTIVKGNIDKMQGKQPSPEFATHLFHTETNLRRMHLLIDQVSELSKLQAGQIKLLTQEMGIKEFLIPMIKKFEDYVINSQIGFKWILPDEEMKLFIDAEKLQKIISIILVNALQYCEKNNTMQLEVKKVIQPPYFIYNLLSKRYLALSVTVSNIQVQIINSVEYNNQKTALPDILPQNTKVGFELVKLLTEIHHCYFDFQLSAEKSNVLYNIYIPFGNEHLADDQIQQHPISNIWNLPTPYFEMPKSQIANETKEDVASPYNIMVISNDSHLRVFLHHMLFEKYNTIETTNRAKGMESIKHQMPDIIIVEAKKEVNNWVEFCKTVKTDPLVNHIPIILLTDGISSSEKSRCYEAGADDLILKPFNINDLEIRIENLLKQREILKEKFRIDTLSGFYEKVTDTYQEDGFLKKAKQILENEIENHDFTVNLFAEHMGISRIQMHRKLKSIIGLNTSEFIRNFRLEQAAKLIASTENNLTQVSYMVGFSNPSYFAQCFKEYFGVTPSHFQKSSRLES